MKSLLSILLFVLPLSLSAQYAFDSSPTRGSISVSGEATVYVVPDIIKVRFGIETDSMALAESQAENREILARAMSAFRKIGLTDDEVQTDFLSVEPRYTTRNSEPVFLGYFSRNGFVVTVKDKATLEQVIDAALAAGVNYLHGVDFYTSELRKYRDQARQMAITAAREKAEALCTALGARLGPPSNINENGGYNRWWYYSSGTTWNRDYDNNYRSQNAMAVAPSGPDGSPGEIQVGKIAVQASVNVNFNLLTAATPPAPQS